MLSVALFVAGVACAASLSAAAPRPVVLWHGMGDSCCNPLSMGYVQKMIEAHVPGVYVRSIEIGSNVVEDTENGFLMNVNDQIDYVCGKLAGDAKLTTAAGFNSVGFSQGGQFLRALQQRCGWVRTHNMVSVGGQHQGVYGLPSCPGDVTLCDYARQLLDLGAYDSFVQDTLVQAEYWQDPLDLAEYRAKSVFLADINNDVNGTGRAKNMTYVKRLAMVNKFVMVMFENDTVVQPRISEHFGFYDAGQDQTTHNLTQSPLYINDDLGLKAMMANNQLVFLKSPGNHLQFTVPWFVKNIITPYLM